MRTISSMQKEVRALTRTGRSWRTIPVDLGEFISISRERLKHVKENFIPTLYQRYTEWIHQPNDSKTILTYPELLGWGKFKTNHKQYYLDRGWSNDEADDLLFQRQNSNTIEGIIKRHGVTEEEARNIQKSRATKGEQLKVKRFGGKENLTEFRRNVIRSIVTDNLSRLAQANCITLDEARTLHAQRANAVRQQMIQDGRLSTVSNTSIDWYLNRGMSHDEAVQARSQRQQTFSLTKCINKHGAELGTEIWYNRQQKWLSTMSNKSEEEKCRINAARINGCRFVSQASRDFFNQLIPHIDPSFTIYTDDNEYYINDSGKFWKYDFTILNIKLIIEYNGTHVHPRVDSPDDWTHAFTKQTKEQVLLHDNTKRQAAVDRGFDVLYVWHDLDKQHQLSNLVSIVNKRTESQNAIQN